jgi:hypothetical protein
MWNNAPKLEWQVSEDEAEWQTAQPALRQGETPTAAIGRATSWHGESRLAERRLAALALLCFVIALGLWRWYEQGVHQALKGDLQEAMVQEASAAPASTPELAGRPYSPAASSVPGLYRDLSLNPSTVQIEETHLQGGRAMVQVTANYPTAEGETLLYRETRFYGQTGEGWQRIEPDPDLMGPWQTLATEHFTIRYRPVDAFAVHEAAPRLDLLYGKLGRDFGVPAIAAAPNITIEVVTDGLPEGYDFNFVGRTIKAPSPALLSVPVEMTDATVFYQSVVYPLARWAMLEAINPYPYEWKARVMGWQHVLVALQLWALWEDDGPLAAGRQAVVRWLYRNAQATSLDGRTALPAGYYRFCRTYSIWGISPMAMSIPLTCRERQDSQSSPWVYLRMPVQLGMLNYVPDYERMASDALPNLVATETILEYSVAAYGRDALPRLIAALGEHTRWQTLIPAVFAVSASEFEAGWQAYLANQYGHPMQ